jgi:DNA gyrase subunit A
MSEETVDFSEILLERMRSYGSYVNLERHIPDVRDGLKTVHRRILYAMAKSGARADKRYQKSAQTVGNVIGFYHPHGDSAVYEAMVLLAQDFTMNIPLVDGMGNWGSVDGHPAAASRYTESRLSAMITDCLGDLSSNIVEYKPNFTETTDEPTVFPLAFPNLLVNGVAGIGWAMATDIPPHNLGEVVDAALLVSAGERSLRKIMRRLPGPDFPTGSEIVNPEAIEEIYRTGQGSLKLRARYRVENSPGNTQTLVFYEIPYKTKPSEIVKKIVEAAREGKITEITEVPKNLSDRKGIRVVVKAKRGGNIPKLVEELYRYTPLESTVKLNFTVLVDKYPKRIGLIEILEHYLQFREDIIRARLENERRELMQRATRWGALLAAGASQDIINKVVALIRKSKDDEQTRRGLIKLLKWRALGKGKFVPISEEQAQWIMDMPLKRINQLNRFQLQEKYEAALKRISEIEKILVSKDGVKELVREELKDLKKKWAWPRKTILGSAKVSAKPESAEEVTLWWSRDGRATLQAHKGRRPASTAPLTGGSIGGGVAIKTDETVYVFTAKGTVYALSVMDIGLGKGRGQGWVPLEKGDAVVHVTSKLSPTYLLVTEGGKIKRIANEMIAASHVAGVPVMSPAPGDQVAAVIGHDDASEILMISTNGQGLRIAVDGIRLVQSGKAGGIEGMKLKSDDKLVGALLVTKGMQIALVHAGHAKTLKESEFPVKGRATGGVRAVEIDKPTRAPAGPVLYIGDANAQHVGGNGTFIDLGKVPILPRATVAKPYKGSVPSGTWE